MRKLSEIIRLAVRESFDFGLTVNHPPTARSPNAAKAVSDCTDAGRNRGGIVLRQTIGASGSWSSAQALGAGKPRSRAPRPPVTFARSNSRQSGTWQLAREKSGSSCYRSRLILTSGELIPDHGAAGPRNFRARSSPHSIIDLRSISFKYSCSKLPGAGNAMVNAPRGAR